MLFREISYDMIIFILAEILQAHFQQIRILLFFRVASFPCPRTWNLELAILNHTEYLSKH